MDTMKSAMLAYAAAAATRNPRQQEAEIFRQVNAGLSRALERGTELARVRAVADNTRLWLTVVALVRDPENALPAPIRASLASVGAAVQREMKRDDPNLRFLIEVNENVAAGLAQ